MKWLSRKGTPQVKVAFTGTGSGILRRQAGAYSHRWDADRAYQQGLQRVTWVYRAVDAIALNAARQPFVFRKGDPTSGAIVKNHPLLNVMNSRSNKGEDSFAFRYRLSSQLMLSPKGVFVEVLRSRGGEIIGLQLFHPNDVRIDPDPDNFIKQYIITVAPGETRNLKPEQVIWLRKPHAYDPYDAITVTEPAGLSIETDWFARLYNRNFLLNDGRPGGMIVVKGDMAEEDKEELRRRYGGNLQNAGRVSVIGSTDGADFVDTAVTPRDAQYTEGRANTKEEILLAFGVPESVLANAGGKTFDNAEQERLVFWMETMVPHLESIARPLDVLDERDNIFAGFDLSRVDVIQRAEMKRREFLLREVEAHTRTINEYRSEIAMPSVKGGDRLYMENTKHIILDQKEDWEEPLPSDTPADAQPTGRPADGSPNFNPDNADAAPPIVPVSSPETAKPEKSAEIVLRIVTDSSAPVNVVEKTNFGRWQIETKQLAELKQDVQDGYAHWATTFERTLERFFERQQRVVTEKLMGAKTRRQWAAKENQPTVETVFDIERWSAQLCEDVEPLIRGAIQEFGEKSARSFGVTFDSDSAEVEKQVALQLDRLASVNTLTFTALTAAFRHAQEADENINQLADRVKAVFEAMLKRGVARAGLAEVVAAANSAKLLVAGQAGGDQLKMWVAGGDHENSDHVQLDGQTVALEGVFTLGDTKMHYPGDPSGAFAEALNCRCALAVGPADNFVL